MKKFILTTLVLFATAVSAQDVVLPDMPKGRTHYTDYRTKDNGYWSAITANISTSTMFNRKNIQNAGADWINGYRFNEFIRIGAGVGLRYYINNDNLRVSDIEWTFPIFADIRGNIISQQDRSAVPFWSVDIGGEIRGGIYFSPTLGYRFGTQRGSVIVGLSYTLQQHDTYKKENENISGVSLKVGYEF